MITVCGDENPLFPKNAFTSWLQLASREFTLPTSGTVQPRRFRFAKDLSAFPTCSETLQRSFSLDPEYTDSFKLSNRSAISIVDIFHQYFFQAFVRAVAKPAILVEPVKQGNFPCSPRFF